MKSNPALVPVQIPIRNPNQKVTLVPCQPGYACLDIESLKRFLKNQINTETYIQQLQNLIQELASPIHE